MKTPNPAEKSATITMVHGKASSLFSTVTFKDEVFECSLSSDQAILLSMRLTIGASELIKGIAMPIAKLIQVFWASAAISKPAFIPGRSFALRYQKIRVTKGIAIPMPKRE